MIWSEKPHFVFIYFLGKFIASTHKAILNIKFVVFLVHIYKSILSLKRIYGEFMLQFLFYIVMRFYKFQFS